jgi:uncharacterized protein (TIGR02147 family)
MKEQLSLLKVMRSRYLELQTKNPSYSIRAFAKKLGIGASTMSMIMNGQRKASRKLAAQIADRLMLDPMERASVLEKFKAKAPRDEQESYANVIHYLKISADQYQAFSEWHYVAILNLVRMKSFKNDSKWISNRLGITEAKAVEAVERLLRLEMLTEKEGKITRNHPAYSTTDDVADVSVRKSHFQTLELAQKSLERDAIDIRDFSWMTMPVKQTRMKEMKEFVRKFQDEFVTLFGADVDADEVYRLSVQMFPLTKREKETQKQEKRKAV